MEPRDILFITLAVCAIVVTGFFAWFMFYLVKIFRTVTATVEDFRDRLRVIDEVLQTIKDKLASTHLQLTALAGGVKELIQWFVVRRGKRRASTRASANQDD